MRRRSKANAYGDSGIQCPAPVWRLPSVAAMVEEARKDSTDPRGRSSRDRDDSWAGGTFEEVCDVARHGWPEGAAMVAKLARGIAVRLPQEQASTPYHDVAGSYVDIGRYVSGEPECMVDFRPEIRAQRVVKIGFNVSVHGGTATEAMMERGAAVAVLVDRLEAAGVRVEVMAYGQGAPVWTMEVCVKPADAPLDMDRVAFALGHPGFFRRLFFGVQDAAGVAERTAMGAFAGGGYGGRQTYQGRYGSWTDAVTPEQHGCDIYLESNVMKGDSLTWVKGYLAKYVDATEVSSC